MDASVILANLKELGLELPTAPAPAGNYVPATRVGNLIYLSGVLSLTTGEEAYAGVIGGKERDIAYGYEAAQACALNALAVLQRDIGFDKVKRLVQVTGYVYGVNGFEDAAAVINGASDLLGKVLGEEGRHTRAAISVNGLPKGASVELVVVAEAV